MSADDHGSESTYVNYRCRCTPCRAARRLKLRGYRREARARLAADPGYVVHGLDSTYTYWGCRCQPCREARAKADRAQRVPA